MELMVRADGEQIHRVRDAPAAETDRRATDGFSRSPLSRASRPFTALTWKVGKGSIAANGRPIQLGAKCQIRATR